MLLVISERLPRNQQYFQKTSALKQETAGKCRWQFKPTTMRPSSLRSVPGFDAEDHSIYSGLPFS
jgi:hypothetical protein